jgi:hypothetical protein
MKNVDYDALLNGQNVTLLHLEKISAIDDEVVIEPFADESNPENLHLSTHNQSEHVLGIEKEALEYWAPYSQKRFYSLALSEFRHKYVFSKALSRPSVRHM